MHFHNLMKEESGAVIEIVAIGIVVLLGFTSLVIDRGSTLAQKRNMQNAADSAALACAYKISEGSSMSDDAIEEMAKSYIKKNNIDVSTCVIDAGRTSTGVKVSLIQNSHKYLYQVFSSKDNKISVNAEASLTGSAPDFRGYILFTDDALSLNCNKSYLEGNVHSNSSVSLGKFVVVGDVTAVGSISANCSGNVYPYSKVIPIVGTAPYKKSALKMTSDVVSDFNQYITDEGLDVSAIRQSGSSYSISNDTFNELCQWAGKAVYFPGTISFSGSGSELDGCLICDGDITFNGSSAAVSGSGICLMTDGNITFNGSSMFGSGFLIAPTGTITLNGAKGTVYGGFIAKDVNLHGSKFTLIYDDSSLNWLTNNTVKLVK